MRTKFLKRNGQSGQASLEVILMLVIGMLVALGGIYRFNTAFKKYTTDLFGTYYRCLLETGELPGVAAICGDKKARFAIANGRDLVTKGDGSGGGSSGGSGSGKDGSDKTNGGKDGAGKEGSSGSAGGRGSGGGGSSESVGSSRSGSGGGSSSVIGRLRGLQKSRSTAVGKADDAKNGGSGSGDNTTFALTTMSRSTRDTLRRPSTKIDFKVDGGEYKRDETAAVSQAAAAPTTGKKKDSRGGDSLRPRKTEEKVNRAPAAKMTDEGGGGLEFGKIFRIFLIIGIIIAIVIFLGGQVLQISKSGED